MPNTTVSSFGFVDLEVSFEFNQEPYDPGCTSGPSEAWYPPEGGDVEITELYIFCGADIPVTELLKEDVVDDVRSQLEDMVHNGDFDDDE